MAGPAVYTPPRHEARAELFQTSFAIPPCYDDVLHFRLLLTINYGLSNTISLWFTRAMRRGLRCSLHTFFLSTLVH